MSEYSSKLESKDMDFLFEGVLSLKTKEECYRFFEDIS
ncbi:MAG TPA: TrpR-like protein YerC/YecD, partial [Clostridium sp.]